MELPHRKRVKHIHEVGHLHELTFSCYRRLPLLVNEQWCALLAESVDRAVERHRYRLIAFVFMPEHVHLLVLPERDASTIPELLKAIKRPYSYRIKQWLQGADQELLGRLTIQQRPGVMTFRYWQEGPGYDRNITEPGAIRAAVNYIHNNPVQRGLCQRAIDWKWSSARRFILPESPIEDELPRLHSLTPTRVHDSATVVPCEALLDKPAVAPDDTTSGIRLCQWCGEHHSAHAVDVPQRSGTGGRPSRRRNLLCRLRFLKNSGTLEFPDVSNTW